ncbi:MAG: hypothetical protein LBH35_00985 [Treponema sp.]|jgi:hypothetical protein|nr:hypothetical protein [Treponema sp.]
MAVPSPVWIDGIKYPSLFSAAEILSFRFGVTIRTRNLKDALEKHGGIIARKGASATLSLTGPEPDKRDTEPAEEEITVSKTVPDGKKKRRLLSVPHWDPSYGGIPERWR